MMKKNNLGFMLVETLIMSMIIIGLLVFMFIQFQNISTSYDKSFKYNTVNGLYITNEIKNYLSDTNLETIKNTVASSTSKYTIVSCSTDTTLNSLCIRGNIKTILLTDEKLSGLKGKRVSDSNISETMYDYINYLKVDKEEGYRILIEFADDTYASLKIGE